MEPQSRRTFLGLAGTTVAGLAIYGTAAALDRGHQASAAVLEGAGEPEARELTPFKDALRVPAVMRPKKDGITEVELVEKRIRLHSQLPATPMWTYQGQYPGPTIEVRSRERIRLAWTNKLTGTMPVKGLWVAPEGPPPGVQAYNKPGSTGGRLRPEIAELTSWISTHLHGGHQHGVSDGGADAAVAPGGSQLAEYPNELAATHLFYHDHAMPVTALNVLAGLMGHYIVRDAREDSLDLPDGKYEIPLAISDVNFDTDAAGLLNGQILAKRVVTTPLTDITDNALPAAIAFEGPYTMVNGVVWPYLDVEARAYRFRILNIALTRSYRMVVVDETTGKPVRGAMQLIGTDLGLLGRPVVIDEALSLAPAERADIVIDFAAFPGKRLKLVNTVEGVPAGTPVPPAALAFPDIMQFRVSEHPKGAYRLPQKLDANFRRLKVSDLPEDAAERFVLLTLPQGMPQLWEMEEVAADTPAGAGIVRVDLPSGPRTLRRVATVFEDTTTFFAAADSWEKWTIISVAPPDVPIAHPIHIHLMNFQLVERRAADTSGFDDGLGGTKTPLKTDAVLPIAPEESGWKDTVVVGSNSVVTLIGQFGRQTGRFMYHCHLLDHEDEGMMRPLVIMPPAVLDLHHRMAAMHGGESPMPSAHHHD